MARLGVGIGLVGRRLEVAALAAALDRARATSQVGASPSGVLLSGDAGVGKSRLVAEAAACARARGFTVLTGRCLDTGESALPYLPFTEAIGALAVDRPALVAEHAALRHLLPGDLSRTDAGSDRELGQLRVFDAVLSVLDELTAQTPVLLVVEDLHWADRSSRDLLVFLLSRLAGQQLVVLATYRSDDLHRRHPLRPLLAELVRLPAVERIDLGPLDDADALALVRQLADGALPAPLLHRVARRSEGNAFFAEELVSACSDQLPTSLVDVLLARIERLPAGAQRLLRVAAVAGPQVRHGQLAAVAGLDVDELERALREAVNHHVLVPEADEGYAFRHALLREAIHHDLLPGERTRLHAAFAALLADPATPDAPGRAARLAHHALAAHDLPGALAASVRAAREADEREAPAELLLHAERALELWAAVPDAETVAGAPEYKLMRMAAWAASATGDPDRGTALGRRALELAEQRGDPVLTASVRLKYALRLVERGEFDEARAAVRASLEVLAGGPPSGNLAWCHAVLARVHYRYDEFADARRECREALEVVAAMRDPEPFAQAAGAEAFIVLASCEEYAGGHEAARSRLLTARRMAADAGDVGTELRTYWGVGFSWLEECRFAAAAEELGAGERRAVAAGLRWSTEGINVRVAHVVARFLLGDWDAAEAAADLAGAAVAARVSARLVAAGLLVAAARGRFDVVIRRDAELRGETVEHVQGIVFLGVAAAETALWQGRPADAVERAARARAELETIERHALGGLALDALGIAGLAGQADGPEAARHVAAATALLAATEETARKGMARGTTLGPEGRAWLERARAEVTRLTGPDPAAWTRVVEAFSYEPGIGEPALGYRGAYALLRRAQARLAVGEPGAADDLAAARATASALRAGPLLAAVDDLAGRAGLGLPGAAPVPVPDLLTPREQAVLAEVARGGTNRQVGATLFISEKTVSVHLSRVMAKLGASSRTEAVALAQARGLLPAPAVR